MATSEKLAQAAANQKWHVRLFRAETDAHQIRHVNGPDRAGAAAQALGGEAEQIEVREDGGRPPDPPRRVRELTRPNPEVSQ